MTPGFPHSAEFAPHFAGYIALVKDVTDPLTKLEDQVDQVTSLLNNLDPARRLYRYAPEKWSIQQLLGHLIDTERIFAYRALRIARSDQTPLPGFDENAYVVAADAEAVDWDQLLAEFAAVRRSNILMLRNLPATAWTRTGEVNAAPISVRALAYIMAGHVVHHLNILCERYLLPVKSNV